MCGDGRLLETRPNQIRVHAAVCAREQDVHWAQSSVYGWTSAVSGIAEFMSPEHKHAFYAGLNPKP